MFSSFLVDTLHVVIKTCKAPPALLLLLHAARNCLQRCRQPSQLPQLLLLQVLSEFLACFKWTQCRMQFLFFFVSRWDFHCEQIYYSILVVVIRRRNMCTCVCSTYCVAGNTRSVVLAAPALPFADALLEQHSLLWLLCHESIQVNMY